MREVLIDGHNAAHRLRLRGGSEAVRRQVVARVRARAPRHATVHFDGHPPAGHFGGTDEDGVAVRFSGGATADDAIVEHLDRARHPDRAIVVTDDRGLARRVESLGATVVPVRTFFAEASEGESHEKPASDGLTPADFGLPESFDALGPLPPATGVALPRRTPRIRRRKDGI